MRSGWFDLPNFGLRPKPEVISCTLSGGGSKASFQIGVLDYLYAHDPEFRPTHFVGASAGAILAAGLSQYATHEEQSAWVAKVTDIWLGMRTSDDMFAPREWYHRLQQEGPDWLKIVQPHQEPAKPKLQLFNRAGTPSSPVSPPIPADPVEAALTPERELKRAEWSVQDIAALAGNIGRLPRIGSDLSSIWSGLETTRSMYRPGAVLKHLLEPEVFDPKRVRDSGMKLRVAMVALESGELRFMDEKGQLLDRDNNLFDPLQRDLVLGLLASCSIPAVFRAVPIGPETYVDGGTRENVPAEMAMSHLGGTRHYVVSSHVGGVSPRPSMADDSMFSVVMRSMEILIDESARDEIGWAKSRQAIVITPTIDVHDSMTVHPGLMQIFRDHGWLRAAEVMHRASPEVVELHRRIIEQRMECLRLEQAYLDAPAPLARAEVTVAKLNLKQMIDRDESELLPDDASEWARKFEKHQRHFEVEPWWLD